MSLTLGNSNFELQLIQCVTAEERTDSLGNTFIFTGLKVTTGSKIDYVGNVFEAEREGEKVIVRWSDEFTEQSYSVEILLSRTTYSGILDLEAAIEACKGGSATFTPSTDAGNNLTTGTDGNPFVPTGASTVTTDGTTISGDGSGGSPLAVISGGIDHNALLNYDANEHVDHSTVNITAGNGLTGGGDLTATRTLTVDIAAGTDVAVGTADKILDASKVVDEDTLASDSDQLIPTQQSVKAYVDASIGAIDHDTLTNFVGNEHVDHSGVSVVAGGDDGLTVANDDLTANLGLTVDITGTTALGATADNADEILIHDASAGALRKILVSELPASVANDRQHADDTTVAPVIAGQPTVAEIQTFVTGATIADSLVYYTGDDLPASTPTYVYWADNSGVVTELQTPVTASNTPANAIPPASDDATGAIGVNTTEFALEDHKHPAQGVSSDANNIIVVGTDGLHQLPLDAAGFTGNLATTDDTLQEVADAFDAYSGNARLFADDTTVSPASAGAPTVAEITTFAGTNRDTVIYYTGSDTDTDTPTYVFHIDSAGNVTTLQSPSALALANRSVTVGASTVSWYGDATALGMTNTGGVITLTKTAGSIVQDITVDVAAADASYSTGVPVGSLRVVLDTSADGTTTVTGKTPIVYGRTNTGTVSSANPLTYNTAVNLDQRIDEFGSGVIAHVFQQINSRLPNGALIFLG